MLILNSGGTFNKRYNESNGKMDVPIDNLAVNRILENYNTDLNIAGVIYKDSLDMNVDDRKMLTNIIMESTDDTFIVVHGTDTMHQTAEFFDEIFIDRKIILVGAMKPFEIDKVESSFNLGMAIAFANYTSTYGVYICMSGYISLWNKIQKNREIGKFQLVE